MEEDRLDGVQTFEDLGRRVYVKSDEILVGGYAWYDDRDDRLRRNGFERVSSPRRRAGDGLTKALEDEAQANEALRTVLRDRGPSRVESFGGPTKDTIVALVKHAGVDEERIDETVIALPAWRAYYKPMEGGEGPRAFERRKGLAAEVLGDGARIEPNHVFWTPEDPRVYRAAAGDTAVPRHGTQPGWKASLARPEPVSCARAVLPARRGGRWPVVAILDAGIVGQRAAKGERMKELNRHYEFLRGAEPSDVISAPDFTRPIDANVAHGMFATGVVIRHSQGRVHVDPEMTLNPQGIAKESEISEDLSSLLKRPGGPPDIVNMSFGSFSDDEPPLSLESELAAFRALAPRTVLVASAGNDGEGRPFYPAACEGVIAVAATNSDGLPMPWSNYGGWVNVCTLGDDVESDFFVGAVSVLRFDGQPPDKRTFEGRAAWSGTSWSAPIVSGLIASEMVASGQTARGAYERLLMGAPRVSARLGDHKRQYGRWLRPAYV